jgi:hypothetical protein
VDGIPATQAALTILGLALAGTTLYIGDKPELGRSTCWRTPAFAQTRGNGNYITLNGTGLRTIVKVNFFLSGTAVDIQPQSLQACTDTTC